MKFSSIIVGALAAVTSAAPVEKRSSADFNNLSGLGFNSFNAQEFQYLGLINSLSFGSSLAQLSQVNGFNANQFSNVFDSSQFNVQSLLEFQQLAMLIQLEQLGAFNNLDLSGLVFNQLQSGLLNNDVFGLDLGSVINQAVIPQITTIVSQGVVAL